MRLLLMATWLQEHVQNNELRSLNLYCCDSFFSEPYFIDSFRYRPVSSSPTSEEPLVCGLEHRS